MESKVIERIQFSTKLPFVMVSETWLFAMKVVEEAGNRLIATIVHQTSTILKQRYGNEFCIYLKERQAAHFTDTSIVFRIP